MKKISYQKICCPECDSEYEIIEAYHAGWANEGFLYCSKDTTVLTWSVYNSKYTDVAGARMPDLLSKEVQKKIEQMFIGCPCGGIFSFDNQLICPNCNKGILSEPMMKNIYCVVIGRKLDWKKENIWKKDVEK